MQQHCNTLQLPITSASLPTNDATNVRRARNKRTTRTTRTTRARRPMRMMRMIRRLVLAARASPLAKSTTISAQEDTTTKRSSQFQAKELAPHKYWKALPAAKARSITLGVEYTRSVYLQEFGSKNYISVFV